MILDIPKEKEEDLKEEAETALTDQTVHRMKGTGRPVLLVVVIQDPDWTTCLTNQKLNAIIVKRQVIMLGIAGIQPRGLKRMLIL
jgi:hypothetical protein